MAKVKRQKPQVAAPVTFAQKQLKKVYGVPMARPVVQERSKNFIGSKSISSTVKLANAEVKKVQQVDASDSTP